MRILLVEDNESDVFFFREALRAQGVAVELDVCTRGDVALRTLREGSPPDLLVLDLNLPRVSGIELLQALREAPETTRIPAVILSSSAAPSDVAAAYAHGARAYLIKPMEFARLAETVAAMVVFWGQVEPAP